MSRVDTVPGEEWDSYVHGHPDATIYHTVNWQNAVLEAFGKTTLRFCTRDKTNGLTGVLPLVSQKNILLGKHLLSIPYTNFGGPLADSDSLCRELASKAASAAEERGCTSIELRDFRARSYPDYQARSDKVLMRLTLPDTPEVLQKALGAKVRSQIRRPEKENVVVESGGAELIDSFYPIFCRNMRDLGTPVYPKHFFYCIAKHLEENVHLIIVRLNEEPVAGCILIGFRDVLEIPWAASNRDFNRYGVNMLLYWEALKYAFDKGFKVFDFGRSTVDAGTYRFKKQWGAKPHELKWQCRGPSDSAKVSTSGDSPKMRLAVKIWQKLPLPIANWLGPKITSNLPW